MTIQQYQQEVQRTCAQLGSDLDRQHMVLGVISEIGELASAYKRHIAYGKELDIVNIKEEFGDLFWFIFSFANFRNYTITEAQEIDVLPTYLTIENAPPVTDCLYFMCDNLDFSRPQYLFNLAYTTFILLGFTDEDFSHVLDLNINKLKTRYPEKFTQENALNRNLTEERTELEK